MSTDYTTRQSRITEIYNRYFCEIKLYFLKYTHDEMQAEDLVQDLFVKLMGYSDMIVDDTAKSFVFTIAKRMMVDNARHQEFVRRATRGYLLEQAQHRFWQDSETLECKQIAEMELAKVRTMPPRMAQVYSLTRFEGKTAQELADELHISKRTVEYHLLVARREVRTALKKAINQ
jgi:RNA polymerase sigma-70 factor (ECF subfamily)